MASGAPPPPPPPGYGPWVYWRPSSPPPPSIPPGDIAALVVVLIVVASGVVVFAFVVGTDDTCRGCPSAYSPLGAYLSVSTPVAQSAPDTWVEQAMVYAGSPYAGGIPVGDLGFYAVDASGQPIPVILVCVATPTTVLGTWMGGSQEQWYSGSPTPTPSCNGTTVSTSRIPPYANTITSNATSFYFYLGGPAISGSTLEVVGLGPFDGVVSQSVG